MQRTSLIESLKKIQEELRPLSLKWAKIKEKRFELRFSNLEELTDDELTARHEKIMAIYNGAWANVQKIWKRLPEAQWDTTFALQMRHLPEYTDLRSALAAYKEAFHPKSKGSNAKSVPGVQ